MKHMKLHEIALYNIASFLVLKTQSLLFHGVSCVSWFVGMSFKAV